MEINMNFYIDTIRENCVYTKNAVKDEGCYTPEEMAILLDGGEVPSDWDEKGNPIEWECLSKEEV